MLAGQKGTMQEDMKTRRGTRWPDKYFFLLFCFHSGEAESHGC